MALEKTVEREEQLFQFSASHVLCVLEGEIKRRSLFAIAVETYDDMSNNHLQIGN
jgi:hypothetical protein